MYQLEMNALYFSLVVGSGSSKSSPTGVQAKVAPGMSYQARVKFTAEEHTRDYSHKLVCTTDREKFLINVAARGARGALDLPDVISFDKPVPVKYKDSKTVLVRNIGNSRAKSKRRRQELQQRLVELAQVSFSFFKSEIMYITHRDFKIFSNILQSDGIAQSSLMSYTWHSVETR